MGKCTYDDGSVYDGDWINDMRHGKGKFRCNRTGSEYTGQWLYDMRHGLGKLTQYRHLDDHHGRKFGKHKESEIENIYGTFSND